MEIQLRTTLPAAPKESADVAADRRAAKDSELRERVDEFVGITFYGTMLKMMRNSVVKGKYGHGGRGEEVFQGQFDMEIASRMGKAEHNQLGEALYRSLSGTSPENVATVLFQNGGLSGAYETLGKPAESAFSVVR